MAASTAPIELPGLRVTLDQLVYRDQSDENPDRPHSFIYFLSIHNDSDVTVTIKARKWVVTDADGEVTVVEGEGVVGQFPVIEPGEKFSYNSWHVLSTQRAVAEGSYLGLDSNGRRVFVRIPRFELIVPETE